MSALFFNIHIHLQFSIQVWTETYVCINKNTITLAKIFAILGRGHRAIQIGKKSGKPLNWENLL